MRSRSAAVGWMRGIHTNCTHYPQAYALEHPQNLWTNLEHIFVNGLECKTQILYTLRFSNFQDFVKLPRPIFRTASRASRDWSTALV